MNALRLSCWVSVLMVSLVLGACGGAGPRRDLLVSVRDGATQMPLASVVVRVEALNPAHPFDIIKQLFGGGEMEPGPEGLTDGDGQVRLWAYTDLPMNILVGAPGYGVETFFFAHHPLEIGPNRWTDPTGSEPLPGDPDEHRRRVQVMFSEPGKTPA